MDGFVQGFNFLYFFPGILKKNSFIIGQFAGYFGYSFGVHVTHVVQQSRHGPDGPDGHPDGRSHGRPDGHPGGQPVGRPGGRPLEDQQSPRRGVVFLF